MDFLQYVASLGGISAVFAVVMFWVYRQDRKTSEQRQREDRDYMETKLIELIGEYNIVVRNRTEAVEQQTKIFMQLYTYLTMKNGHSPKME
jgi:hypothetical protein